jgi:hypothetical protein
MTTTIRTLDTEPREVRRNYIKDPRFVGVWGFVNSTATISNGVATVTAGSPPPISNFVTPDIFTGFLASDVVSAGYQVKNRTAHAVSLRLALWNGTAYAYGATLTLQVGQSGRVVLEGQVLGATTAQPRLHVVSGVVSGDVLEVSQPILEKTPTLGPYFDGATSPNPALTASWTGTPNASESILTGTFPVHQVSPVAVEGYEAARETSTVIHEIVGAEFPDASIRPAGSRRGRMRLAFATETEAVDAFLALAYVGVFTCTNPTVPGIGMPAFVVAGEDLTIEADDTGAAWWVGMPFVEVAP